MIQHYFSKLNELFIEVENNEKDNMILAANQISASIQNDGIVHIFGCGHSHILAEEAFYRAGGLAPINPIFEESLMLHEGATRSSNLEKQNGYADTFLEKHDIRKGDVIFVVSTSGRNPVPIDTCLFAKERGAFVIGITSVQYANSQASRHISKKHLHDVVDLVIDNHSVSGDAILTHPRVPVSFTPTSTVIGTTILNAILSEAIKLMVEDGFEPPIFLSGNLENGSKHNQALIEKYENRIPLLTQNNK
ncbi:putative phosphosugar-binding protein [Bacillus pakistanensis]|uniref:UPF0309 protein JOC86_002765 n=1 Tax=Rossellomorea pakistanensis TaxID=992288 RepID=A0ABS2NEI4_9BACI|nr:SIS domain-containing protein [Bacillus pakistanensis]MBM7586223.1 putative phosphosugar-binding protein [Bacillus pakistanensis]